MPCYLSVDGSCGVLALFLVCCLVSRRLCVHSRYSNIYLLASQLASLVRLPVFAVPAAAHSHRTRRAPPILPACLLVRFFAFPPPNFCPQELCNMMIECCSQERTWLPYYGLIAQRFCMLHRRWQGAFTECFETNYNTIHR